MKNIILIGILAAAMVPSVSVRTDGLVSAVVRAVENHASQHGPLASSAAAGEQSKMPSASVSSKRPVYVDIESLSAKASSALSQLDIVTAIESLKKEGYNPGKLEQLVRIEKKEVPIKRGSSKTKLINTHQLADDALLIRFDSFTAAEDRAVVEVTYFLSHRGPRYDVVCPRKLRLNVGKGTNGWVVTSIRLLGQC